MKPTLSIKHTKRCRGLGGKGKSQGQGKSKGKQSRGKGKGKGKGNGTGWWEHVPAVGLRGPLLLGPRKMTAASPETTFALHYHHALHATHFGSSL